MNRRIFTLKAVAVLSLAFSADAATLTNFNIVNSSSFSMGGGIFTSGANGAQIAPSNTFSGWFNLDVSSIPDNGAGIVLPSWDIVTKGDIAFDPFPAGFNVEFTSANSQGFFVSGIPQTLGQLGKVEIDDLRFQGSFSGDEIVLDLYVLEPFDTFHGGIVYSAIEQSTIGATQSDSTGTGFMLDPAVFSPEPGGELLLATGLGVLLAVRRRLTK
jgi:hypothetical protein